VTRRARARPREVAPLKWLLRIAVVVSVVVVGRELHLRQTKLMAVAGSIEVARDAIDRDETGIDELERDIGEAADTIGLFDARITAIERRYPQGIPPSEWDGYRRLVDERNALAHRQNELIERQRRLVGEYEQHVAAHNAEVEDASALAREDTPGAVVRDLWARLLGGS
jgi:hypothetical protein